MKKASGGQSLFEVVVALAISALVVVSLVSLVTNSIRNANFSKNKSLASNYAQETTEWLRSQRDSDVSIFQSHVLTPIWCFSNLNWNVPGNCATDVFISGTIFKREALFSTDFVNGKTIIQATINVSWQDTQGEHNISSVTNFSDWRER